MAIHDDAQSGLACPKTVIAVGVRIVIARRNLCFDAAIHRVPYTPMIYKKSFNLLILLKNLLNLRTVDNALRTGEKRISKGN